ncbi:MAG: Aspartyl/asparaginyl beta-hydroxylase [Acidimicrobiales bacterium]|nr:Aspartyl/asparaginyl beta-hydroxylase [Acidimicrobiales bacterium]
MTIGDAPTHARRLDLDVDAQALAVEVARLPDDAWLPHFNQRLYDGDWSGVALRTIGGRPGSLYPDPNASGSWADAPVLGQLPRVAATLDRIACPLLSARLLRLGPGASVDGHTDLDLSYDDGELRLHIPITTGPGACFLVEGQLVEMAAGECWYVDLTRVHAVRNDGPGPRVHLVVDCTVDPWMSDALGFRPPRGLDPARARG